MYTIKSTKPDFISEPYVEQFDAMARLSDLKKAYEKITVVTLFKNIGLGQIVVFTNHISTTNTGKDRIATPITYWISKTN